MDNTPCQKWQGVICGTTSKKQDANYIEVYSEVIHTSFKTITVKIQYPKKNPNRIEDEITKSLQYNGLFDDIQ